MFEIIDINIIGVGVGFGFNLIASILVSAIVTLVYTSATGISMGDKEAFEAAFSSSFEVKLSFLLFGLIFAFLMGIVAELFSKNPTIINSVICGAGLFVFNTVFMLLKPKAAPLWSQITISIGVVPLAILGGYIVCQFKYT